MMKRGKNERERMLSEKAMITIRIIAFSLVLIGVGSLFIVFAYEGWIYARRTHSGVICYLGVVLSCAGVFLYKSVEH